MVDPSAVKGTEKADKVAPVTAVVVIMEVNMVFVADMVAAVV